MTAYEPGSRRPIAGIFRRTAHAAVGMAVKMRIHPDVISYASIVSAAIAAWLFWQSRTHPRYLLLGVAFAFLRLWLNMFDGMVALAAGKASKKGEIVNDLPDRLSDVLIFAGIAHSGWCNTIYAYWVAIAAVLVAYVGLFGQAVGVQREFSGVMAKPWRIVALSIGAIGTMLLVLRGEPFWFRGFALLDWTHFAILLGCAQTVVIRLLRIFRALPA
ncbi:MAG TPA: CDP-alcohol phosphatidyltransferase family protein [Thermoanaerobaculia bacterium]|nr:CDP-alcohol phosphatidyltransferase family protein [Thermoanaerobaculia bacterium]